MAKKRRGRRDIDFRFPPILKKLKRGPQIILPKDLGLIVAFSGMNKDSVVVDAGTGSAFAAVFFGSIAKKVITFEEREDFATFAAKNIKRSELTNITLRKKNIFTVGFREKADVVVLDLLNPEKIFRAKIKLAEDATIVAYTTNVEQFVRFTEVARKKGYETFTIEGIIREMWARDFGTRPQTAGLTHTGYLTFARKLEKKNQEK